MICNKESVFSMLSANNHSKQVRESNDYYATNPVSLIIFLKKLKEDNFKLHNDIWECACGEGHLSKVLEQYGYNVYSTDLIDRGYGTGELIF